MLLQCRNRRACSIFLPLLLLSIITRNSDAWNSPTNIAPSYIPPYTEETVRTRKRYAPSITVASDQPPQPAAKIGYQTKSTFNPEQGADTTTQTTFSVSLHEGMEDRRTILHQALLSRGINPTNLLTSPDFTGCHAAQRSYNSFLLPKSAGALAIAQTTTRATTVANSIDFLMREYRSVLNDWVRNHDRSLQEADDLWAKQQQQSESVSETTTTTTQSTNLRNPLVIILDNVRSAHNVGNIIRACEASRITKLYLCGMTPAPPNAKVLKTALSSAAYVPYQHVASVADALKDLRSGGDVRLYGVETTSRSQSLWDLSIPNPQLTTTTTPSSTNEPNDSLVALIFGNELVGVDAAILEECDELISVPMFGMKNSLNVATCASVVIWEILRQWSLREE